MTGMNTQRGVPYDPGASVDLRKKRKQIVQAQIRAESKRGADESKRESLREHARKLDQIEHAWKERARDRGRSSYSR